MGAVMADVRHLFLDLEDTVITPVMDGWFNTHLINVPKVKAFIAEYQPTAVHLFSFAIWDAAQRDRFNQGIRPRLESALGTTLSLVPTVDDDIIPVCCKVMGMGREAVDFSEMSNFWGKQIAFKLYMQNMFKNTAKHDVDTEVVLLDDVVFNEHFFWPDVRVKGCILNIDQL
jgi:hypothetical protein